ncbi:MAG: hypothetical protein A3H42_01970 [Deltaproteobacteria bacterium RIFCSPLOWO2_02_FULL_46_8]|nr:MAG: hypothetical protein A3H42_01970 [Deltaproteobacteria bacterium RIFCSPLOWO2_02_FULL_46_8]
MELLAGGIVVGASLALLWWLAASLLAPWFYQGAPFVPSRRRSAQLICNALNVGTATRLMDLGSGDGRILIEASRRGARAEGIEINPLLALASRCWAYCGGVKSRVSVTTGDLYTADVSNADVVVIYGLPSVVKKLEGKLSREMKPGACVASIMFRFPQWAPERVLEGPIYIYRL